MILPMVSMFWIKCGLLKVPVATPTFPLQELGTFGETHVFFLEGALVVGLAVLSISLSQYSPGQSMQ